MTLYRRWIFLLLAQATTATLAITVNRTIDDERGDVVTGVPPEYYPPMGWAVGATCTGCISLAHHQVWLDTWHDTTEGPNDPEARSVTAHFNGTAVYVFCALVNQGSVRPGVTALTKLSFEVDGAYAGDFLHVPTDANEALYQVPVFASGALSDGPHTIALKVVPGPNHTSSLCLFDYFLYTTTEPDPTNSTTPLETSTSTNRSTVTSTSSHPPMTLDPQSITLPSSDSPPSASGPPSPNPSSPPPRGVSDDPISGTQLRLPAAIGGAVGGVLALTVILCCIAYGARRRRQQLREIGADGYNPGWTHLVSSRTASPDMREESRSPGQPPRSLLGSATPPPQENVVGGDVQAMRVPPTRVPPARTAPRGRSTIGGSEVRVRASVLAEAATRIRDLEQRLEQFDPLPQYEEPPPRRRQRRKRAI